MDNRIGRAARAGFTLVEVLVTLVLLALLLGVVVPGVIGQLDRGEPTRIIADLESVRDGAQMFRVDVKRFPATVEQLVENPTETWDSAGDINAANIPQGLLDLWSGPYLEEGGVSSTTDFLRSALGASIHPIFTTVAWNGTNFLTIRMVDLDTALIERIDTEVDGAVDDADGRLRFTENVAQDTTFLQYLAVPIN